MLIYSNPIADIIIPIAIMAVEGGCYGKTTYQRWLFHLGIPQKEALFGISKEEALWKVYGKTTF